MRDREDITELLRRSRDWSNIAASLTTTAAIASTLEEMKGLSEAASRAIKKALGFLEEAYSAMSFVKRTTING